MLRRAGSHVRWLPTKTSYVSHIRSSSSASVTKDPPIIADKTAVRKSASNWKLQTLVTMSKLDTDPHHASSVPIYQTASFDCRQQNEYDYTRSGNPTRKVLQDTVAKLEGANYGMAFTSGMAALTAVLRLLKPGNIVLCSKDIYGGMHRQLLLCAKHSGVLVEFVETWDIKAVEQRFAKQSSQSSIGRRRNAIKMVCLESPTNPQMRVSDIRVLARLARANEALLLVDNSILSPVLSQPLSLGADLVVHSATKYLAGHADTMAGVVLCNDEQLASTLAFEQNASGTALAPFDCWLVLRGIKTMVLRVKAAQDNAVQIYDYLCKHPHVKGVNYLSPMTGRAGQVQGHMENEKRGFRNKEWRSEARLHYSQSKGAGGLMSFEVETVEIAKAIVKHCRLFKNTVSFGSINSLIEIPAEMSHASIPADQRTIPPTLIRLAVGIEDAGDLIQDIGQAISRAVLEFAQPAAEEPGSQDEQPAFSRARSRSLPLGETLPPMDLHAVGVSMPQWDDVVGYEEGCTEVHSKLRGGYPRFVFLHAIKQLFAKAESLFADASKEETAMVFASARVALRFQQFLNIPSTQCHDLAAHGAFAVTFPKTANAQAKQFWQHTGEIPSSRLAAAILEVIDRTCYENKQKFGPTGGLPEPAPGKEGEARGEIYFNTSYSPRGGLKQRISALTQADPHNIFLYPTGMAALTATQRLLKLATQWDDVPLRTVVFGFPYLDTLKLAQLKTIGSGCVFLGMGDQADLERLRALLETERISGLYVEFPSNPLLKAPDMVALRQLADEYNFVLIVDDTVAGFCNVDLGGKGGADIIMTSLTKQWELVLQGALMERALAPPGNVMGGCLRINEHGAFYDQLASRLARDHEELLFEEDANVLLNASTDVELRTAQSNNSALAIVDLLRAHPLVKHVCHPSIVTTDLYDAFKREGSSCSGYGGLLSVTFKDPTHGIAFFNSLDFPKGPGFGTNFSLVCPYTILAHYNELDWARDFGVDTNLVRIWTGQEDERELLAKLNIALDSIITGSSNTPDKAPRTLP
eukprot:g72122.t1